MTEPTIKTDRQTLGEYFASMGWDLPEHKKDLAGDAGVRMTYPDGSVQWTTEAKATGAGITLT